MLSWLGTEFSWGSCSGQLPVLDGCSLRTRFPGRGGSSVFSCRLGQRCIMIMLRSGTISRAVRAASVVAYFFIDVG
jgi:hypothetical protein